MATRVTSKGQVTIPVDIREAAHVVPGTELEWTYRTRHPTDRGHEGWPARTPPWRPVRGADRFRHREADDRRDHGADTWRPGGMTGFLIDTSVLLDLAGRDPIWLDWSRANLEAAANDGLLAINPVIYAEFSLAYTDIEQLDAILAVLEWTCAKSLARHCSWQHGNSEHIADVAAFVPVSCPISSSGHMPPWKE